MHKQGGRSFNSSLGFLALSVFTFALSATASEVEVRLKRVDQLSDREVHRYEQIYQDHVIEGAETLEVFTRDGQMMFQKSTTAEVNAEEIGEIPKVKLRTSKLRKQLLKELDRLKEHQNKPNLRMALNSARSLVADVNNGLIPIKIETILKDSDGKLKATAVVRSLKVGKYVLPFQLELDAETQDLKRMLPAHLHLSPTLEIYNANYRPLVPFIGKGDLELVNGKRRSLIVNKASKRANETFRTVTDLYKSEFGRDSYDGQGAKVSVIVNVQKNSFLDIFKLRQNAAWSIDLRLFLLGGGNSQLDNFEKALDVIAHEFTHAVIDTSSGLKYEGQSGALNEHFADLFGIILENKAGISTQDNRFLIGDSVLKPDIINEVKNKEGRDIFAIRDMLHPNRGLTRQPEHVRDIPIQFDNSCRPDTNNDSCGVHYLSGVPNRATALMIEALGIDRVKTLFYNTMMSRMMSHSKFSDYATALKEECAIQLNADECRIVEESLIETGLL